MNKAAQKYIKQSSVIYGSMIVIGIAVFISGTFFNFLREEMAGICIGLLPTGILGLALTLRIKDNPETRKMLAVKTEERNQFIRYKSAYFSFWITFIYVSVATILSRYISLSLTTFLIITLIGITLVHIISTIINHKSC